MRTKARDVLGFAIPASTLVALLAVPVAGLVWLALASDLRAYLAQYGIVIEAWFPLGHGDAALREEPVFAELAEKYGYADGGEAFDRYTAATQQAAALRSEIARLQKTADELRPWGDFSVDTLRKLADKGVVLRYFFTSRAAYEKDIEAWSERYTIALVHEGETFDYFVVVTRPGEEVVLDAQEVKAPTMDCRQTEAQIAEAARAMCG